MIHSINVSENEKKSGVLDSSTKKHVKDSFLKDGSLIIDNVIDDKYIADLHDYYMEHYGGVREQLVSSSYKLDHERYFVVPRITSLFNDARLYANPVITEVLSLLLGPHWIYRSIVTVMSFPGAKAQGIHIDHPLLFNSEEISVSLPPYCITVVIPLVDANSRSGGTRVWPRSHLKPHTKNGELVVSDVLMDESEVLEINRGGCYLMDYRLTHGGEPNISDAARPIITLICTMPWFQDNANYGHIPEVVMTSNDFEQIPEQHQKRFLRPTNMDLYTNIGMNKIDSRNISRNSSCYCGSGIRYKHCHGQF